MDGWTSLVASCLAGIAALLSGLQYLAPYEQVERIRGGQTPIPRSGAPPVVAAFVTMSANALLWAMYGLLQGDPAVTLSAAFGVTATAYYLQTYYNAARSREARAGFHATVAGTAAVLSALLGYVVYLAPDGSAAPILGVLCALSALAMIAVPALTILRPKTKAAQNEADALASTARTASFRHIAVATSGCLAWTLYGILVGDLVLTGLNAAGTLGGATQLVLSLWMAAPAKPQPKPIRHV